MNLKIKTTHNYLWAFLIPVLIIGLLLTKVDVRTDITDFFFAGNDPDSAFLINQFNSDRLQRQTILSIAHSQADIETVFDFMTQFQIELMALEGVERVWTQSLDAEQLSQLVDLYKDYRIALFSLNPNTEIPDIFKTENLESRLKRLESLLLGPDPQLVKSLVKVDPMLLTLDWLERIQTTFNRISNTQDYSILFLESKATGMQLDAQKRLGQHIFAAFENLTEKFDGNFTLETTGVPVFAMKIKSQISEDIGRVSMLSMLMILVLFIIVFRSVKSLILTACLLVITVSSAVLVTQLVFGFVHGLTLALGVTLMGICIDYFIHAMINASEGNADQCVRNVVKIWPSLILGGCTTVIGYIALAMSGFPGLQQIAVFSVAGIFVALLMTRYIIPLVMLRSSLRLKPRLTSHRLLRVLSAPQLRWVLVFFVLACFGLGVSTIRWSDSLDTLTPELEHLKTKDSEIRSRMTNIEPGRFVLTQASTMESALQRHEVLYSLLAQMRKQGMVDAFFPIFPWIASEKLQAENIDAWNKTLNSKNQGEWQSALTQAGFFADAFPALEKSQYTIFDLDKLKDSPAWSLLSQQLLTSENEFTIVTWLGRHDVEGVKQGLKSMSGVRYFSHKEKIDALSKDYRKKAQTMLFAGLAAIFILLMLRFRSALQATKLLLPALLAILFVLGIAGIIDKPLNMIHLIGLLLTAAICVDYSIFFIENRSNNHCLTFQAITASALTSAASFACLGIAQNPALQALAWTVSPGIIIGFLLCPVILQASLKHD